MFVPHGFFQLRRSGKFFRNLFLFTSLTSKKKVLINKSQQSKLLQIHGYVFFKTIIAAAKIANTLLYFFWNTWLAKTTTITTNVK